MDFQQLSMILSAYIPTHLIIDHNHQIAALSKNCAQLLQFNDSLRISILNHIQQSIRYPSNSPSVITSKQGKKFTLKHHRFNLHDQECIIASLHEYNASGDPVLKLHCLEEILNNINDGVIVSDSEGKIILYNPAQERLEELSSKEVIGKYLWEAYNYQSIELSEHRKVFHSGNAIVNNYSAHTFKNGVPKYLSYCTYPIHKDGEIVAVYSVSKNETILKNLLSETIDLKRKLRDKPLETISDYKNGTRFTFSDIIGDSDKTTKIIAEAQGMALFDNNLLIVGETGTGKEVFAQSIHNFGKHKTEPFVAINCGAIPENLLESTLFGTVKGSYTGALDHLGLFEEAQGGTLFLDELNSLPFSMQSKLLRVLQERKVRPVGGQKTIPIRCRIICAVNEDPQLTISHGKLRQDLFYRIASLCLHIPPLRERITDLDSLCHFFIERCNRLLNKKVQLLDHELRQTFLNYSWPGNIRELEHVIENLMIRIQEHETILRLEHIPPYLRSSLLTSRTSFNSQHDTESLSSVLRDVEKKLILDQLDKHNWNISQTSRALGIVRQSLIYRMRKLDIHKCG